MVDTAAVLPINSFAGNPVSASAPVTHYFQSYDAALDLIVGYAAPERGPKPSVVELLVGDVLLGVSRASRFSQHAKAVKLRLGWCGFELAGVRLATALDGPIVVRCASSRAILSEFDREKIEPQQPVNRSSRNAMELLNELRLVNGTTDLSHVAPFILDFCAANGTATIIETFYRYFLRRSVDESGKQAWNDQINLGLNPIAFAERLIEHAQTEQANLQPILQGPFEPGFPFGLLRLG